MVDTRALLKTFGEGADVIAQIATDKSTNARRQTASTFDIRNGQLIENLSVTDTLDVPHSLGRLPKGAFVLFDEQNAGVSCTKLTTSSVTLTANSQTVCAIWVV